MYLVVSSEAGQAFECQAWVEGWRMLAWVCVCLGVSLSRCLGAVWLDMGLAGKSLCGISTLGLLLCCKL